MVLYVTGHEFKTQYMDAVQGNRIVDFIAFPGVPDGPRQVPAACIARLWFPFFLIVVIEAIDTIDAIVAIETVAP